MMQDTVVVITGAGRGLGRELVRTFSDAGAAVYGVSRPAGDPPPSADGGDPGHQHLTADVADFEAMRGVFDQIVDKHGRVDVLFNNAAVYPRLSFLEETPEQFAHAMAINVCGVATCCKLALAHMTRTGFGRIFNVGSWADVAPIANSAAYSASKGALHALTKAIAADVEPLGADIEVHEWIPGHLNTRMSEFTGIDPAVSAGWALALAREVRPDHRSRIYENDREWLPPKPLKQRVKEKVLFWR